jgi:hypothetical protein
MEPPAFVSTARNRANGAELNGLERRQQMLVISELDRLAACYLCASR